MLVLYQLGLLVFDLGSNKEREFHLFIQLGTEKSSSNDRKLLRDFVPCLES